MMYGYGYGYPDFGYAVGGIINVVFWIVLIVLVVRLVRGSRPWRRGMWQDDHALDILKERYAKGEISKEEFEAKKKDLMS